MDQQDLRATDWPAEVSAIMADVRNQGSHHALLSPCIDGEGESSSLLPALLVPLIGTVRLFPT